MTVARDGLLRELLCKEGWEPDADSLWSHRARGVLRIAFDHAVDQTLAWKLDAARQVEATAIELAEILTRSGREPGEFLDMVLALRERCDDPVWMVSLGYQLHAALVRRGHNV